MAAIITSAADRQIHQSCTLAVLLHLLGCAPKLLAVPDQAVLCAVGSHRWSLDNRLSRTTRTILLHHLIFPVLSLGQRSTQVKKQERHFQRRLGSWPDREVLSLISSFTTWDTNWWLDIHFIEKMAGMRTFSGHDFIHFSGLVPDLSIFSAAECWFPHLPPLLHLRASEELCRKQYTGSSLKRFLFKLYLHYLLGQIRLWFVQHLSQSVLFLFDFRHVLRHIFSFREM